MLEVCNTACYSASDLPAVGTIVLPLKQLPPDNEAGCLGQYLIGRKQRQRLPSSDKARKLRALIQRKLPASSSSFSSSSSSYRCRSIDRTWRDH